MFKNIYENQLDKKKYWKIAIFLTSKFIFENDIEIFNFDL